MLILVMGKGVTSMSVTQKIILGSGVPVTFLFVIIGYLAVSFFIIIIIIIIHNLT